MRKLKECYALGIGLQCKTEKKKHREINKSKQHKKNLNNENHPRPVASYAVWDGKKLGGLIPQPEHYTGLFWV